MSGIYTFLWSSLLINFSTASAVILEDPASDFNKHSIVQIIVHHARTKREIGTTRDESGAHHSEITITVVIEGEEEYILDLQMNQDLITDNHVLSYQKNGETIIHKPQKEEIELCEYSGSVRGKLNSWVALSTCEGVQGVVFDGENMRYIEPVEGSNISSKHYLYDHQDLSNWHQCGHINNITQNSESSSYQKQNIMKKITGNRFKRYASDRTKVHVPYNANKQSRYVELVLVADYTEYTVNRNDKQAVHRRMKTLANIVNSIYSQLNIFIALVGVVIWTEGDQVKLEADGDKTLNSFLEYREKVLINDIPNDNAHLITHQTFLSSVIGKAPVNGICTSHSSGGVENMHSRVMGLVASTVAHEMGHNFGMEHDNKELCDCPDQKCIMSSSSTSVIPVRWSSCSLNSLALTFGKGNDYCLSNKPKRLFYSSLCGNGFVEADEECDCGTMVVRGSHNPCHACCDPNTCRLRANATCASGKCCDLTTCRPRSAGTVCRSADRECDLPEYCTGHSEFCPDDVYKMDTTPCGKGKESAYCVNGKCRSHASQCRLLWGPTSENGHISCYMPSNKEGNVYGHCGYDHVNKHNIQCRDDDVLCGMLKCFHLYKRPQISIKRTFNMDVTIGDKVKVCHSIDLNMQSDYTNLGMVPDGAKCGEGKMCLNQKCVSVLSERKKIAKIDSSVCPSECSGHGVCNSAGHCHCEAGFAPPLCSEPGLGGSYESGPIADPMDTKRVMIAIYAIFLGIVPSILLITFLIHYFCPNTLKHCCGAIRKLEKYCKLQRMNTDYINTQVNERKQNKTGHRVNNINNDIKTEYVIIQPIFANNESTYTNCNNLLDKIHSKTITTINKDDIEVPHKSNKTNIAIKSSCKENIQIVKDNIPKEKISKKNMPIKKKINKEDIQLINKNKECLSKIDENLKIKVKDNTLQTVKKKINKDDIHVIKKDENSTNATRNIVKNDSTQITNINKDLQSNPYNKTNINIANEKVNGDNSQAAGNTRVKEKDRVTNTKDIKNKPLHNNSLPKETKIGVSVKEIASVINDMATNCQNDISNVIINSRKSIRLKK